MKEESAALVPESTHVIAERSGHDIHPEQPELVVAAIPDVVAAVREPGTWKAR
jgi:pimeloyl-ACP methyl ester carboxylesterase